MKPHTTIEPAAEVDRLITLAAVLELLGVSRSKVYGLVADGAFQPVKIGRRSLFSAAEIQAYIQGLLAQRHVSGGAR